MESMKEKRIGVLPESKALADPAVPPFPWDPPARVGITGGLGEMGQLFTRFFADQGYLVSVADLNTAVQADLSIVDANRILTTNGPKGPGKVEHPEQLIFGTDPVAVDAYAATPFKKNPFDIPHIKIAHDMRLGTADLGKVDIVHVDASSG